MLFVQCLSGYPHDFDTCLLLNSILLSIFAISMFSLVAVSFDRCWAITFPVSYQVRDTTLTKVMIISCWIFGIIFGFVPSIWQKGENFQGSCDVSVIAELNYLLIFYVSCGILSTLAIVCLYFHIYRVIVNQVSQIRELKVKFKIYINF